MDSHSLWKAIIDLHILLSRGENSEKVYQNYFESNPVVFSALGYTAFASFEKSSPNKLPLCSQLGMAPEPDFLCARHAAHLLTVFELKTPFAASPITSRSDGNRTKFRAELSSYISQVQEYLDCIRYNSDARQVAMSTLSIDRIADYSAIIVYGMNDKDLDFEVKNLLNNYKDDIDIITFENVLDCLATAYSVGRRDTERHDGFAFFSGLLIDKNQANKRSYIVDIGSIYSNRVSIFMENDLIVIEIIDNMRLTFRSDAPCPFDTPTFLLLQFANTGDGMFFTCTLDGRDVDHRLRDLPLNCKPDLDEVRFGSDLNGSANAKFSWFGGGFIDRTFGVPERVTVEKVFREAMAPPTRFLEFDGTKSMKRDSRGLVAPTDEERPIVRELS